MENSSMHSVLKMARAMSKAMYYHDEVNQLKGDEISETLSKKLPNNFEYNDNCVIGMMNVSANEQLKSIFITLYRQNHDPEKERLHTVSMDLYPFCSMYTDLGKVLIFIIFTNNYDGDEKGETTVCYIWRQLKGFTAEC